MSQELKPCPFCQRPPQREVNDIEREVIYCSYCPCPIAFERMSPEYWNHRPIEDALRAELAALHTTEAHYLIVIDELARKDEEIKALNELVEALQHPY